LKSWILLLAKGCAADVQDQIIEQLDKWQKEKNRS